MLLLVEYFSNTTGFKRMPLLFQMNIDKDLLENDMNLDGNVLLYSTNAPYQIMRNDGVTS